MYTNQIPIVASARACVKAVQEILQYPIVALDCEGVNLSKDGRLCLVQIATPKRVYLFDVLKGGERLFIDKGLRAILENKNIIKIVHDCRKDSEALYFQYGVLLQGVWDSQIAYALLAQLKGNRTPYPVGLNTLFRLCGVEGNQFKDSVKNAMSAMKLFWEVRPLSRMMVDYAAADVKSLLSVYSMINAELTLHVMEHNFKKMIEEFSLRYVLMNISVSEGEEDGDDGATPRGSAAYNLYGIKLWDDDIGLGTREVFVEYKVFDKSVCPVVPHFSKTAPVEDVRGGSSGDESDEGSPAEEIVYVRRPYTHNHSNYNYNNNNNNNNQQVYADGFQQRKRYNSEHYNNDYYGRKRYY